jgi:methyl-accepting chemotaxis protein
MNLNTWTIATRIIAGFVTLTVLSLIASVIALTRFAGVGASLLDVAENTVPSITLLADVDASIGNMIQDRLLMPQLPQAERAERERHVAETDKHIVEKFKAYEALITDAEDRRLYEDAKKAYENVVSTYGRINALVSDGKGDEAQKLFHDAQLPNFDKMDAALAAHIQFNVAYGNKAGENGKNLVSSGTWILQLIMGVSLLLAVIIGYSIIRSTNNALHSITVALENGAVQTASAAGDVSSASQGLSSGATEQAAAIEETSASLEEVSSMIRATAENAQKAKQLASEARTVADSGTRTMTEMNEAMAAIDASSAEVAKIVKNIDEIAFQTNILALNAAVEAARAGEAGAGFAVVADEVRSLAQRSAAAARETAEKIDAAIANSRRGAECTNEVGRSLLSITEKVSATDTLVGDIASAAREQAQGITQISVAINQMDSISQTNSSTAEQCASSAEQLSAQSEDLKGLVQRLASLVGGSASKSEADMDYSATPVARTRTRARRPAAQHTAARPMQSLAGARKQVAGPAIRRPGPPASIPMPAETAEASSEPDTGSFRNF